MGQVFDLDLPHNEAWVLVAMADHADHEGKNVFPSVELVAYKTGYEERQVRRIQQKLRERGVLVLVEDRRAQNLPHVYDLDLSKAPRKAPRTPGQNVRRAPDKAKSGGRPAKAPDILTGGTQPDQAEKSGGPRTPGGPEAPDIAVSDEPSDNPQGNPPKAFSSIEENGLRPAVDKPVEGRGPRPPGTSGEDWTDGRLMALTREKLYAGGEPPPGYDDGRDMTIIRDLQAKGRRTRSSIALAIEGLASMRGERLLVASSGDRVRVIEREEPVTLRLLYSRHGVRPLFDVAVDVAQRGVARVGPNVIRDVVARELGIRDLAALVGAMR